MNSFADLVKDGTVKEDDNYFTCKRLSVADIVNKPITILGVVKNVRTEHGNGRYILHFKCDDAEGKCFTNSRIMKNQLDQIPAECFPLTATIQSFRDGNRTGYKLT